jgi:maltose O-acetyltransferase
MLRWLYLNSFAGSVMVPRLVRAALYRVAGIRIRTANIRDHCVIAGRAKLSIGEGTFVNRYCHFDLMASISIGRDCQIAPEVFFCTATHDLVDGSFAASPHGEPIVVGDRCWLGVRATVLPGSVIDDDCIIAAGAVVRGRCEPWGLYAGVPARRVRELRSPAVVDEVS